jgi:hypothetical protein
MCVSVLADGARAAVSYSTAGGTYSQSFDSLSSSGSGTGLAWTNDSTLVGWSLFNTSGAALTTYGSDDGGSTAGQFWSYGVDASSDRAIGGLGSGGAYFGSPASGALAGHFAVQITNNTGSTLVSFTLEYDGEQWRNGGNTTAHTMLVEYGFGATFSTVGSWTAAGAGFNFTSPVATASAGQLNGNLAANRVENLGGVIGSLNWLPGESLWVRFRELNDSGNDHGLAIDDFGFTAEAAFVPPPPAVPAPAALPAGLAVLAALAGRRR